MRNFSLQLAWIILMCSACMQRPSDTAIADPRLDSVWVFHTKALIEALIDGFAFDYSPIPVNARPNNSPPSGCYEAIFESLSALGVEDRDTLAWALELKRLPEWDTFFLTTTSN